MDAAIKFSVLKVRNLPGRSRRLSATGYVEWVLGDLRPKTAPHITTEVDPYSGALYARNPYNTEFPERVAFFDVDDPNRTGTCDRTEFLGRHGSLGNPAALGRAHLSGKQGSCLDPCAALQVVFTLADGQEREITFRLGLGGVPGGDDANRLVHRFRGPDAFGPSPRPAHTRRLSSASQRVHAPAPAARAVGFPIPIRWGRVLAPKRTPRSRWPILANVDLAAAGTPVFGVV